MHLISRQMSWTVLVLKHQDQDIKGNTNAEIESDCQDRDQELHSNLQDQDEIKIVKIPSWAKNASRDFPSLPSGQC